MKEAIKENGVAKLKDGPLSPILQASADLLNSAVKDLETTKSQELPMCETEWLPTLWRSYLVFGIKFGSTVDDPHGHGWFLSLQHGSCLTSGQEKVADDKRPDSSHDFKTDRILEAMEKSNALAQDRTRREEARAKLAEALMPVDV